MTNAIHLLKQNRSARDADGAEITLPALKAVAVLFLSHGRNAWHSTWVMQYKYGDFFREGGKVRAVVERRRERGTVFYLSVLPAFQFDFGERKFIVTEINTQSPFRYMDLDAARFGVTKCSLGGFLDLMEPGSWLWKKAQSRTNSIIVQEVKEDFIDLAAYAALSKGSTAGNNPPVGDYERCICGSRDGVSSWYWTKYGRAGPQPISLRWYTRALAALVDGRERQGR